MSVSSSYAGDSQRGALIAADSKARSRLHQSSSAKELHTGAGSTHLANQPTADQAWTHSTDPLPAGFPPADRSVPEVYQASYIPFAAPLRMPSIDQLARQGSTAASLGQAGSPGDLLRVGSPLTPAPTVSVSYSELDWPTSELPPQAESVVETHKLRVDSLKGATFVNQYIIIKTIGFGAFGKVKLCLNSQDHRLYAIKLINKATLKRNRLHRTSSTGPRPKSDVGEVMQEIAVMKRLRHPNIVRLVEVIDDPEGSKLLLVMEYVEGGPLMASPAVAEQRCMPEVVARKYFRDVIQGLDYLHFNRVVHGDLKPENMLLAADGRVKISDFGSAHVFARGDTMLRTAGTPAFLAPEMCEGKAYHGRVADLWALGICLYMFVFGVVPFKADTILRLYEEVKTAPLRFPGEPAASKPLRDLLRRMLEKDAGKRLSMAQIMAHPWVSHQGSLPLVSMNEADPSSCSAALAHNARVEQESQQGLDRLVQMLSPLFHARGYEAAVNLAAQGSTADTIFYIEEGQVEISYDKQHADEDFVDGEESDDSDASVDSTSTASEASSGSSPMAGSLLQRLGSTASLEGRTSTPRRQATMLRTMLQATVRAAQFVTSTRLATREKTIITTRGPGDFIGEVAIFEQRGGAASWATNVRAKTPVTALVLTQDDLRTLLQRTPEAEIEVRAAMAQRKSELLKMETLERIAGFQRDLERELELSDALAKQAETGASDVQPTS
ncbi:hypothetical protein WJX72_009710 [[Myrmecia] bisecta]|uniref:cGMP-dependent protein kinase n=1 Tax=[Myrmecia] bisecta TaxID=41462 RepID=A0AAW1R9P2_9CHLO